MKKLFLVEDNFDNADLVCDILGGNYHIVHHADPMEALAALTQDGTDLPDLLLLDIGLPGMDGANLLRHIRAYPRLEHIPAIALTAHAMKTEKENLVSAGFNGYVSKPITDEELLIDAINEHLPKP